MKKVALLVLPILASLILAALPTNAATPLAADMSKAVTIWQGSYSVGEAWDTNTKHWVVRTPNLQIVLDDSVLDVIKGWEGNNVYIVVTYDGIDGINGRGYLPVCAWLRSGPYCTNVPAFNMWTDYSNSPRRAFILVPRQHLIASGILAIGFPMVVQPPTNPSQSDAISLRVIKVQLAPVKLGSSVSTTTMAANVKQHSSKAWLKYAVAGAVVVAIIAAVATIAMHHHGRR